MEKLASASFYLLKEDASYIYMIQYEGKMTFLIVSFISKIGSKSLKFIQMKEEAQYAEKTVNP